MATSAARPSGSGTTGGPAATELSKNRRYLVLAVCCSSLFIVGLDTTILNVGLPSLKDDLRAPDSGLQWTIDAYGLVIASLLLFSGSMGDRFGRRRIFRIGLVLFSAGSLLCSLAPTLGWLIAFRMVQAVGGSMLNPVAMGIITNTFTDRRERARAIGIWGGVIGLSMAVGPVLGGLLVQGVSWRSIFWINVPVGIAALVLTTLYVPESKAATARRFDPLGQLLVAATLGSLTYAIIEAPAAGWTSTQSIVSFSIAAAALAGLVGCESRRDEPLLDLRFFRSAPFAGATAIAACAFAAMGGFLFLNTLYLQNVRGYSALHAGLMMLPMAAVTAPTAPLSGRLVANHGPRPSLLIAGVALPASGVLLAFVGPDTSLAQLICAYVLFGLGFGMVNAPITNTAVSGMPLAQAGVAGAVASTSRQVGMTLGVAVFGSVAATHASSQAGPAAIDPTSAPAWWIMVGCGAAIGVLGVVTTGRWARATAARTAALFVAQPRRADADVVPAPGG
ncbi:DHA2 family efflux MFS transporter permease subunit [Frankia sp. CNm7]|uniref:DHA2 family efflux MFS transporter permease subunit n=1 Tax=Frankia nepalensis TaxID=1836974 RepID=A0A937UQ52_9ACTN|nr:DHA2 family efflux MFS transporter permease subunit [Frankia nepalensis]MBL7498413.1 DHA2 family efflux MFS transporter permease subunit [Frankia nepalensis]MBL7509973.1 DHA2 family efflux MFS transporter permease subunit [Frankia nepalensis]MBL7520191.1 DHA2 family efflux MFS transporter permease subunit [Frankia nepalensis]MBL7629743.1 DHA2 family efflux MFS transporter permease subunit [Frankia nepalensis]